jgi:integral membrane sensor domain MASE1
MTSIENLSSSDSGWRFRDVMAYAIELVVIGAIYFALAEVGLRLASVNPHATPIWPSTGFALAAVLLRGYRIWPAFLIAAFAVNAKVIAASGADAVTATMLFTALAIGVSNTLEALFGAYLLNRWSGGRNTFETPAGVARFAALCFVPTALCASIGATTLAVTGFADWSAVGSIWLTWWLGERLRGRPGRLQSAVRALRQPRRPRVPGRAAAIVVGTAGRPARYR